MFAFFLQKQFWEETWFGLLIALAVISAIILLSILIIRVLKNLPNKIIISDGSTSDDAIALAVKVKDLENKNKNLEKSLQERESQIRRLQKATKELSSMNLELRDQIDKLDNSNQEMKNLHEKKEELMKIKEEMFGAIVHDIKNPVSLIKGFAELLNSYDLSRQEQDELLQAIIETSNKMVTLSNEMTKLIIIDSSDLILEKEDIKFYTIVNKVVSSNLNHAQQKSITIISKVKEDLPSIKIDPRRIEEVLENLVNNAIKYTPHKGYIEIFTQVTDDCLMIHVKDNGLGLSEDEVRKVFLPFQRLRPKPTANEPSSGVGLSIVKRIIEMHGGRIWVTSKIGEGSTFSFSIPFSEE